jgi:two-component system invasion response regulator UvrY
MPKSGFTGYLRVMSVIDVFLCDDTPELRELTRHALEADPALRIVGEASDGDQAAMRICALQPDVVVLDLSMPHRDGAATIPLIRRLAPAARIVMFSSHPPKVMRFRSRLHRADLYVQKGQPIEQLRLAVLATVMVGRGSLTAVT